MSTLNQHHRADRSPFYTQPPTPERRLYSPFRKPPGLWYFRNPDGTDSGPYAVKKLARRVATEMKKRNEGRRAGFPPQTTSLRKRKEGQ